MKKNVKKMRKIVFSLVFALMIFILSFVSVYGIVYHNTSVFLYDNFDNYGGDGGQFVKFYNKTDSGTQKYGVNLEGSGSNNWVNLTSNSSTSFLYTTNFSQVFPENFTINFNFSRINTAADVYVYLPDSNMEFTLQANGSFRFREGGATLCSFRNFVSNNSFNKISINRTNLRMGISLNNSLKCDFGITNGYNTNIPFNISFLMSNPQTSYLLDDVYFNFVNGTCSDSIQNHDETGIDCGGNDCIACNGISATSPTGVNNTFNINLTFTSWTEDFTCGILNTTNLTCNSRTFSSGTTNGNLTCSLASNLDFNQTLKAQCNSTSFPLRNSTTFNVITDNIIPITNLTTIITSNSILYLNNYSFNSTCYDNRLNSCSIYIDNILLNTSSIRPYHSFNLTNKDPKNLSNGKHNLYVEAIDLGGNRINSSLEFYTINLTTSNNNQTIVGVTESFTLQIDKGNTPLTVSSIKFYFNNTEASIIENNYATYNTYIASVTIPNAISGTILNGSWYVNISGGDNITKNVSINLFDVIVGFCNQTVNYTIANFSYYDATNNNPINVSVGYYNLTLALGGSYNYLQSNFIETYNNSICTNLNPTNLKVNWSLYGNIILGKTDYISKVYNIQSVNPYIVGNNYINQIKLYLLGSGNSSTVTFNWYTTDFQTITGSMRVYRCNIDGSKDLIETVSIISGEGTSNIELLTTSYYYDIIINNIIYTELNSYSQCHVESVTERTYYVTLNQQNTNKIVGLYSVECSLYKNGSIMTMIWGSNQQDTSNIQGCIIGYIFGITGKSEIYRECINGSTMSKTVPSLVYPSYYFIGELSQNGVVAYCSQTIEVSNNASANDKLGFGSALAVVLFLIGMVLLFNNTATNQLLGLGIGILGVWILGFTNHSWVTISAYLFLLIFIGIIARYSRKQ